MVCVDGVWKTKSREKVSLGASTVSCLLAVNREMWAACESSIHVISTASSSSSNKLVITKVCSCCRNRASLLLQKRSCICLGTKNLVRKMQIFSIKLVKMLTACHKNMPAQIFCSHMSA